MGQAKQRGSFEDRKALAIARQKNKRGIRPRGKSRLSAILAAALALGQGSFFPFKK